MSTFNTRSTSHYKSVDLETRIETASPHELIAMLLQGTKNHIQAAETSLQHNKISDKGEHVSKAIGILDYLRSSLNHENGGDLSANLDKLYEYIQHILLKGNLKNDPALLKESVTLIGNIQDAWLQIKPDSKAAS